MNPERKIADHNTGGSFGKKKSFHRQSSSRAGHDTFVVADREAVIRRHALKKLVADARDGVGTIAQLAELPEQRIKRLVDGDDVLDAPLAMHIEQMLALPDGWMENSDRPIPKEVMSKISSKPEQAQALRDLTDRAPVSDAAPHAILTAQPEPEPSATPSSTIKAAAPVANPTHDSPAQRTMRIVAEVFPAVRKFLIDSTPLSPSTISGAITGSRGLPEKNQNIIEQAFKVPKGWLAQQHTQGSVESTLRKTLGDLLDLPPPKRGRQAEGEIRLERHAIVTTPTSPETDTYAVITEQNPMPVTNSLSLGAVPESGTKEHTQQMGRALIAMLEERLSKDGLDNKQIAKIMQALFL